MFKRLIIVWFVIAAAIAITAALVPSVEIEGGFFALLGVALVFGLVNAIIGPLVRLISLPLTIITFGLFALVINAGLLAITAGVTDNLNVGGFFACVLAALLISVLTTVMLFVVGKVVGDEKVAD